MGDFEVESKFVYLVLSVLVLRQKDTTEGGSLSWTIKREAEGAGMTNP